MIEEQLTEIEARAEAASRGPIAQAWCAPFDAAFIAHAREDVPALVALVREYRAALDAVLDALAKAATAGGSNEHV